MTELLSRPPGPGAPRRPRPDRRRPGRSLTVTGVLAALQAAGLGILAVMVLVLVGWATAADSGAQATTAVVGALQVWLVGHHAELAVPGGHFSLTPLGLTAVPAALLHTVTTRAGHAAGVRDRSGVIRLTCAVTATYALTATAVALVARTGDVRPLPLSAFVGAAALAAVAAGTGALRSTGRAVVVWHRLPAVLRLALPAATGALCVLAGGASLVVGASLAVHHDDAELLLHSLDAGPGGTVLLLVASLAYVPTAAVWGMGYAVGPGFAVGQATSVTPFGSDLGAVPAVPLLAALPSGPGGSAGVLALGLPVLAGVVAALLLRRATDRAVRTTPRSWRQALEPAAVAGGLVGLACAALTMPASGGAGPGRMSHTGPDWWAVGPVVAIEVAVVAAATLLLLRRRD